MSSDNQEVKVERRRIQKSVEDRIVAVDTATEESTPKVERRRAKVGYGATRDKLEKYKKYIPAGYVGRFEDPSMEQCEFLYDQDWEFAKDEDGGRVLVTANRGKDAESHRFVLMIKRQDYYDADKAEEARRNKQRLHSQGSLKNEVQPGSANSSFTDNIGYKEEKI